MKSKILSTMIALMCLVGLISVTSAAQAGNETKIVPDQRLVVSTAVYGNLVTWYETTANDAHIYHLSIGKELDVPASDGVSSNMEIYGSKVVWQNMDYGISLYDITTKELTQIENEVYGPDIYKKHIVYEKIMWLQEEPYTLCSLYLYDITTKEETQITDYIHADYKTAIYGNKIVWVRSDEPSVIYIYDIASKKMRTLNVSDTVSNLDISGNTIVWESRSNEISNIYISDVSTQKITQITMSGSATEPAIYGNRIVYLSENNVYMYEKSTGKTIPITSCGCAYAPSIYKDKIVYADSHEAGEMNWELGSIYMYDLSAKNNN
jgi:beta propeller repeat protein